MVPTQEHANLLRRFTEVMKPKPESASVYCTRASNLTLELRDPYAFDQENTGHPAVSCGNANSPSAALALPQPIRIAGNHPQFGSVRFRRQQPCHMKEKSPTVTGITGTGSGTK